MKHDAILSVIPAPEGLRAPGEYEARDFALLSDDQLLPAIIYHDITENGAEATAHRLAVCWNTHDALVSACTKALGLLEKKARTCRNAEWKVTDQEAYDALASALQSACAQP